MQFRAFSSALVASSLLWLVSTAAVADIQSKIIGGEIAADGKYPETVAILFKDQFEFILTGNATDGNGDPVPATEAQWQSQFCAGTLIADDWVVTAAHCMVDFVASELLVLEGEQHLLFEDNDTDETNAIPLSAVPTNRITVSAIIRHPDYNVETFDSDLALLKLSSSVSSASVAPRFEGTLSPLDGNTCDTGTTGDCATIVGWGTTDEVNGSIFPYDLHEVEVPLVSTALCNGSGSGVAGAITDNMFCAGFYTAGGKDTCQGDSGGPIFVDGSGGFEIAGVTSFGNGCAMANSPGVYTDIRAFKTYIDNFLNGSVNTSEAPVITTTQTEYTVSTNLAVPTIITSFDATDSDGSNFDWSLTYGNPNFPGDDDFFSIDANGQLTLSSVPATVLNPYELIIKVSDGEDGSDYLRVTITMDQGGVSTSESTVQASPATVSANGSSTSLVTVTLNDNNGNAVSDAGDVVAIGATGDAVVSAVTNNNDGSYTATVSNATIETVTVSATVSGNDIDDSASIFFVEPGTAGLPADVLQTGVTESGSLLPIANGNESVTLTFQLRDSSGNNLPAGGHSVLVAQSGSATSSSVVDNGDGTYSITLTSLVAETVTVSLTVDGETLDVAASVTFFPGPAEVSRTQISRSGANDPVADGVESNTFTYQLRDEYDNELTSGGDSVIVTTTSNASLSEVTDNGDGTYSVTVTNNVAQAVTLTLEVNGEILNSAGTVVFIPGPADASNTAIISTNNNTDGSVTINIQLYDANDNALTSGGDTVSVSATGGASVGNITDNGDGSYTAVLTNSSGGTTNVSATVNGTSTGTLLSGVNIPGSGSSGGGGNSGGGGGGGSAGVVMLMTLMGIVAFRRRREVVRMRR